jgi:hypothetical protein
MGREIEMESTTEDQELTIICHIETSASATREQLLHRPSKILKKSKMLGAKMQDGLLLQKIEVV